MVDLSGRTNRPAVSEVPITEATRPPEPAVREWDMGGGKTEAVDVYHASPHEFEKFDSGKIGTGEGTQDEGHGLYFAENKAVHESYLRTLEPKMEGGERFDERNPAHIAAQELHYSWNEGEVSKADAIKNAIGELRDYPLNSPNKRLREDAAALLEQGKPLPAYAPTWVNSYQVKLHVNQDLIMHRDLPFGEQPPAVQKAMEAVDKKAFTYVQEPETRIARGKEAGAWFDNLRRTVGDKEASDLLQKEGLQGLKYMDSGSVGKADPTHNYVIFRDNRAQITHINEAPFAPDATPAEKIASLSRQELMDRLGKEPSSSPTLFRDLAKDQDPATQDLAAGYDHTASWARWLKDTFYDVLNDESGSVKLGPFTFLSREERQTYRAGKNYGDELWRSMYNGLGTQRSEFVSQGFEKYFKDIAPHMPAYEAEIAKGPGGDPSSTVIGQLKAAMEGKAGVTPDSSVAPFARHQAAINDILKGALDERMADGRLNKFDFIESYLHHNWTNESIQKAGGVEFLSGRTGNTGFTRGRTHATVEDGIAAGLVEKYPNPIINEIEHLHNALKVINTVDMQQLARNTLDASGSPWMKYFTNSGAALKEGYGRPLVGLNSSKSISTISKDAQGNATPGPVITQTLYAKPGLDRTWNNAVGFDKMMLSEGTTSVEQAMLKLKNGSTYLKLIFPGFHTLSEFKQGMASSLGNAAMEAAYAARWNLPPPRILADGSVVSPPSRMAELGRAFRDIAKSPFAAPEYVYEGKGYRDMYRAMEADPALDAWVSGGGSIASRSKVYAANDSPTIWKQYSRGMLADTIKKDVNAAFTFPSVRNNEGGVELARDFGNLLAFPFHEAANAVTSVTAPIWDHGIPLLKAGAGIERMQTFMRQNPTASEGALSKTARQIQTSIEDRMGEYDPRNLFWHPIIKRITNQMMLSTTWTYGTIHATLTGLGWNPGRGVEWNPHATTNLMGQLGTIALTNAAWSYLVAGKPPDSTLDYLIPFANARGMARLLLPGEEKEYHDWAKVVAETYASWKDDGAFAAGKTFAHGAAQYGVGKLAPDYHWAIDLMSETNRIGERVELKSGRHAWFGGGPGEEWVEKSLMPIIANNWSKGEKIGLDPVSNATGVREAPKSSAIFAPWSPEWRSYLASQTKLHNRWSKEAIGRENREEGTTPEKAPREYKGRTPRGGGSGNFAPWGNH